MDELKHLVKIHTLSLPLLDVRRDNKHSSVFSSVYITLVDEPEGSVVYKRSQCKTSMIIFERWILGLLLCPFLSWDAQWWTRVYRSGIRSINIIYCSGKANSNADALSHNPVGRAPKEGVGGSELKVATIVSDSGEATCNNYPGEGLSRGIAVTPLTQPSQTY